MIRHALFLFHSYEDTLEAKLTGNVIMLAELLLQVLPPLRVKIPLVLGVEMRLHGNGSRDPRTHVMCGPEVVR